MLNLTSDQGEGMGNGRAQIPVVYTSAFLESWFVSVYQSVN